ncbi:MAG: peptidoglycan bridge formation glycyltransferase FemA/FemB family protein [bacterium]|nr:peptidoglycan bridge formation glycyltransferase FemA/FemB family protein [bacterium]
MDKTDWNKIIQEQGGSFLQSWEWGGFQESYGRSISRIVIDNVATTVIVHDLPLGMKYLFSPYGPVGALTNETQQRLLEEIKKVATKHKAIFWRYERGGNKMGGKKINEIHPQYSWILKLQEPEKMLANMKSKWRYNIKLATKKGVTIRSSTDVNDLDRVYTMLAQTAERQGITIHAKKYFQLMLEELNAEKMLQLYIAEFEDQIIAANIMIGFGETMTYVHGGSDYEHRKLMAPHALQWEAIKDAQIAGYKEYDFFGIAPPDQPDHKWAGITRFKQGFGGDIVSFDGTYELSLNQLWYNAYKLVKRLWT